MDRKFVIGVDLGGTNVRAAVYGPDGEQVGERVEIPSKANIGILDCVSAIAQAVTSCKAAADVSKIGMAVPGHIQDGVVRWAPNFVDETSGEKRQWRDVPLASLVSDACGAPVVMGNDANLAALGEYRFGVGKNSARGLVLITLGTGIGTGVVLSPECVNGGLSRPTILIGGSGGAPELGHQVIQESGDPHPSGAVSGTLEAYCCTSSILRRAWQCDNLIHARSPKDLFDLAEEGVLEAKEVWDETGFWLGVGIANLINGFAPQIIALGGKISLAGKWILEPAKKSAQSHSIPTLWPETTITLAERVEDAGILGAVALAQETA